VLGRPGRTSPAGHRRLAGLPATVELHAVV